MTSYDVSMSESILLPTPFVTAGIGLVIAMVFPGGMTGGEGFLLGLLFGVGLVIVRVFIQIRDGSHASVVCPQCSQVVKVEQKDELKREEELERKEVAKSPKDHIGR